MGTGHGLGNMMGTAEIRYRKQRVSAQVHVIDIVGVAGSIPAAPTIKLLGDKGFAVVGFGGSGCLCHRAPIGHPQDAFRGPFRAKSVNSRLLLHAV